ncbi:hypothetical protein KCU88_g364, partial [Aureobasidium melanogenum]
MCQEDEYYRRTWVLFAYEVADISLASLDRMFQLWLTPSRKEMRLDLCNLSFTIGTPKLCTLFSELTPVPRRMVRLTPHCTIRYTIKPAVSRV